MSQLYKRCLNLLLLFVSPVLLPGILIAQSHTPRSVSINTNCGGFYEYLPQNYNTNQLYPLIVYLHGDGDRGNGSTNSLALLLEDGPTKYINNGSFPASFTVNGQTYSFIVISPQFAAWPNAADVEAVLEYAISHYAVDRRRIYITGMSMGGGVAWEYAGANNSFTKKIAALVPVCGASAPNHTIADRIAREDLPVWATHNEGDNTVPVYYTNDYINYINTNPSPPTPLAQKTIFPVADHDAWTTTYNPTWKPDGLNVYEWMLQYERDVTNSPTPVTLTDYKVTATVGREVMIKWTTSWEQHNEYFTIERSADGTQFSVIGQVPGTNLSTGSSYSFIDNNPVTGNNYYRLSQTDFDGTTTRFRIQKVLIGTGNNKLLLFPNPAKNVITIGIDQPAAGPVAISFINAQGATVHTANYRKGAGYWQQELSVTQLPAGIYWISIKGDQWEDFRRLLKQ